MPEQLPGWYPDPAPYALAGQERYWDGSAWRPQVRAGGSERGDVAVEPVLVPQVPSPVPTLPEVGGERPVDAFPTPVTPQYVVPAAGVAPASVRAGLRAVPLWAKIAVPALVVLGAGGLAAAAIGEPAPAPAPAPVTSPPVTTAAPVTRAVAVTTTAGVTTARPAPATTASTATTTPTTRPAATPITAAPGPAGAVTGGLDPRYGTCREAKAHGLGPYYRGRDPEYDWYRDGDSDGIVCE